jgi:hypothetical protein
MTTLIERATHVNAQFRATRDTLLSRDIALLAVRIGLA